MSDSATISAAQPDCGNGCWSDDTNRSTGPGGVMSAVVVDNPPPLDSFKQ